jgi:hypothetical protein
MTASTTIGSIASINPFTPITPLDNDDVDDDEQADSPDDAGHLATPHHPHPIPSSIALNRTLDIVDRVGDIDEPKVPHQLAAAGQIESGGTLPPSSSVVTHEPLIPSAQVETNDQTESVRQSPDSDQFEFDVHAPAQFSIEHHELVSASNQMEANDQTEVDRRSTTSDQSNTSSSLSTNVTTPSQEEFHDSDSVQQSSTSDQSGSTGSIPTNPTTADPMENGGTSVVQRSLTSEQSEDAGALPTNTTAVELSSILTPPAKFALDQFDALVHAFAGLSSPFTYDGDIVMPEDQNLKLYVCEKGYNPEFKPQPAASRNKHAKSVKAPSFDKAKE